MIPWLLKLFGANVSDATSIADWSLQFRYAGLGWVVLGTLGLGGLAFWLYHRSPGGISRAGRYTMAGLRGLFFLLLMLLLLQPVLQLGVDAKVRRALVVLLDASASMQIQDPRSSDADLKRAALAKGLIDPRNGLGQSWDKRDAAQLANVSRADLVRAALHNSQLSLLKRLSENYDLVPYTFGKELDEVGGATNSLAAWLDRYKPASQVTALGDAVREVLRRQRGQAAAGAFVLTDGGNNSGDSPLDAAALARQENLPLYIYGVGITSPKDIIVANLFSEDVAFVKDELTVTVRVKSQGLAGEKAALVLKLGDQPVAEKEVLFTGDTEQVVELQFTPQQTGEFELRAAIDPRPDEAVKDNNVQTKRLRVVDTKIKVLLIEQSPRWEFRYLLAMLTRDRRMDVKALLFEADPGIALGEGSPYLPEFPKKKEDLFKYDVIVFGDVDPKLFATEQLESLRDYVAKFGGAMVMIAGKRFSPAAYQRTPLEPVLPVEIEAARGDSDAVADRPIAVELTAVGKESPMLQLADKPDESQSIWRDLPPIFWIAHVSKVKPAAEVLLTAQESARSGAREKTPVLVLQRYGLGQTLFMGTDSTWRWRRNAGDKYFTMLWSQIVQRMALSRLLGEAKRTQLSCDRRTYITGDRVTVYARLYTPTFEPINEPLVKGRYALRTAPESVAAGEREVTLRPLPGQPGIYRGEFSAPAAGAYKFFVERDPETGLDFDVREPKFEFGQSAMNEPLLKEMAAVSGGAFLREEDLYRLPELVGKRVETVRSYREVEIWSSPLVFLLLLLVTTVEWLLRKKFQLK